MSLTTTIRNCALALGVAVLCGLGAMAQDTVSGAPRSSGSNTPVSTGSQTTTSAGHRTGSDREFVRKAAQGGLAEVHGHWPTEHDHMQPRRQPRPR